MANKTAKKKSKKITKVYFDLNMRVTVAADLSPLNAYWCIPGYQKDGKKPGFTSYLWDDHLGFKLPDVLRIRLDYPFDEMYEETMETDPYTSVGHVVFAAAQAYKRAYKRNVGYWHGIGDLVFEGMTIHSDGLVEFDVGS